MNDAISFLKSWCGETGPFSVGAIDSDDETSAGHDWLTTRDLAVAERFVEENAARKRNLYLQINLCRPDLGTMRANRANVAVALCVHAEIDPSKDVDNVEALSAWQIEKGAELYSDVYWVERRLPRPTAIIFSGTGFVCVWRLEEPVVLWRGEPLAQEPTLVDAIESRNRALVEKLGADSASTDVSRLLRLPGTMNVAGESKKKKGRTEAVLAEIIEYEPTRLTSLGMMPAAAPMVRVDSIEIPDFEGAPSQEAFDAAAEVLGKAWAPDGHKHEAHLALSGGLARAGWPAELIADFAVAVAEADKPGNGKRDKRLTAAQTSVTKVRSGHVITGWPSLIEHVGEEAVAEARKLLGFKDPIEYDPEFTSALVKSDPPTAEELPTRDKVRSALESTRDKLKRKTKEDAKYHGKLLGKVLSGDKIVREDEDSTRALCEAALVVVRHVPAGTSDEQIAEVLLGCASSMGLKAKLVEIVQGAKKHLDKLRVADVARRPPDEFRLEGSGPRADMPIAQSQHNIRVALGKLGIAFRYNAFADFELISRDGVEEVVQDHHIKILRNDIERLFDFRPEKDFLFDTCEVVARENTFHPILDYLDGLTSDITEEQRELPETWLIRYAGAEDTPYVRAVSRLMLVAAVRRVRDPGCLFQEMLILETPTQGKGKSEGLRALCPDDEWFTDDFALHTDDSKKMLEQTDGKWIIEAAELKGFLRSSDDSVKQYLSRREDQARMAFGRKTRRKKRQFVIFGTLNDLEYFKDMTGNRRYWPVRVKQFDKAGIIAVRDALWAAASLLEREHPEDEYIRLDPSLYAAAAEEQEKRRLVSPVEDILRDLLDGVTGALKVSDLYPVIHDDKLPNKAQKQEITSVLQSLGFMPDRTTKVDGRQSRWYMRGDTDTERFVRISVNGSKITGFELKLSQTVPSAVVNKPQGPEISTN